MAHRPLKIGDRVSFKGSDIERGTVTAVAENAVVVLWDNGNVGVASLVYCAYRNIELVEVCHES